MQIEPVRDSSHGAAKQLARLMERELGFPTGGIDPIALRLFIKNYWSRVSKHAHDIHDQD